jgi:hypothetical protein
MVDYRDVRQGGFVVIRLAFLALTLSAATCLAGDPPAKSDPRPAPKKLPFTPEREAAGLAFANANHPELAELLGVLKTMNQLQYETAVVVLSTQAENLAGLAKRDADMHRIALQEWKAQSRVNVLAAKAFHLVPDARKTAEAEMRKLLEEQSDLRIARKQLEIKRVGDQLRKTEEQLQKLKAERETWIAQQLKRGMKTKDKAKQPAKKSAESPSKKPEKNP